MKKLQIWRHVKDAYVLYCRDLHCQAARYGQSLLVIHSCISPPGQGAIVSHCSGSWLAKQPTTDKLALFALVIQLRQCCRGSRKTTFIIISKLSRNRLRRPQRPGPSNNAAPELGHSQCTIAKYRAVDGTLNSFRNTKGKDLK